MKLLDYVFCNFIIKFGSTFKYEENNDFVSNDDLCMFL